MRDDRRGLTLPELLVSMGILSLMALLLSQLTWSGTRALAGGEDRIALEHEMREAKRRVELCLSTAGSPGLGTPALVKPELDETTSNLRFLSLVDLLETGVAQDPANPVFIEYRLRTQEGGLWLDRVDGLGEPERVCRGVSQINYTNISQRAVLVELTIAGEVRNARNKAELQTRQARFTVSLPPTE